MINPLSRVLDIQQHKKYYKHQKLITKFVALSQTLKSASYQQGWKLGIAFDEII